MGDVLRAIRSWAARQPGKLLYVFLDSRGREIDRLTYQGFMARVETIAGQLHNRLGVQAGARLIVAYPPGLEMICAFFGCVRAGIIPVPAPGPATHTMAASLTRIGHMARDCGAAGVLSNAETIERLVAAGDQPGFSELRWTATDTLGADVAPAPPVEPGEMMFLQYTSGSTSAPKGVIVSHDNILANAKLVLDHEDPVAVSWLPQHHDMGLIGYYINSAIGGGTLYGFSPASFIQRPALWLETISRVRATASSAPNFAFEHCLLPGRISATAREGLDLSSLRFLMAAAEPIRPGVYRQFLEAFAPCGLKPESFVVAYGLAENTLAVSSYGSAALRVEKPALACDRVAPLRAPSAAEEAADIMSCGRPLGDNEVRIVDPASRRLAPADRVGEIWIAGQSKCRGYWGKPEESQATFEARLAEPDDTGRGYLRTGDMGFLHAGELYVCGRRKDMLIVRGQNYYPHDVESVVERAPGVRQASVAAVEAEGPAGPEIVVLAEVAARREPPDARAVAEAIRSALGLQVDRIVFLPPRALPKTSSGKLMRFRASQLWQEGALPVLAQSARLSEAALEAQAETGAFSFFKAKYGLTGGEPHTLIDAGLDSLDLVLFMHELAELLKARGADDLADAVDTRLVQQMSIAELFRLAARFDQAPETAISQVRRTIALAAERRRADEAQAMLTDRGLAFEQPPILPVAAGPPRKVFMTGATGFLGPFLLASLLAQTKARVCCLVRGEDPAQARARLREALAKASERGQSFWRAFEERVEVVCGDLAEPGFGLSAQDWARLAREADTIYHNGAVVNYLLTYGRMRPANVLGTNEALRLAFEGRPKAFNYISTTFIFGWAVKDFLFEADANDPMERLDFGYSQSKWVAEQLVMDAARRGLGVRIFRPSLVTPALNGDGANFDITIRLLAFMVNHGLGVNTPNQVSFTPVDVTANNIVAIAGLPQTLGGAFHVTRDDYCSMMEVTEIVTRLTGRRFHTFDLARFVPEIVRRCTPDDLLFPLLDFLVGSIDNISAMKFKRYDSHAYQAARNASPWGLPDPPMEEVVAGMLRFMQRTGVVDLPDLEGPVTAEALSDARRTAAEAAAV